MTQITRIFTVFSLSLVFLAIPILAGAEDRENHRINFTEHEGALTNSSALYASVNLTTLEEIAGKQFLDYVTIRFLEENIDLYESTARLAIEDADGGLVIDYDMMRFLELNTQLPESTATFASDTSGALYPSPEEVENQRAGELNY